MDVAHEYRVPHSVFLSWSKDDRDKAIWHHVRRKQTCKRCGTRPAEWDPEQGGDRRARKAMLHICPGCEQIDSFRSDLDRRESLPKGATVTLVKRG